MSAAAGLKGKTDAPKETARLKKVIFVTAPVNFRDEEYFEPKKIIEAAGIKVVTVSLKTGTLAGMMGGKTESDGIIQDINPSEYEGVVFIGGSGAEIFWDNPSAHALARHFAENSKTVGAICAAPVTLEKAGVLKGKKVAAFPSVKKEFKSGTYTGNRIETDGRIVTAAGPEVAADFAKAVLESLSKQ
ncbi:MAG: DJ-1/PfpI family protein [Endomicrobiia bacterium]|nr:DJ-1/PfpI family protein [Endomicrobiia bacterium]